MAQATLTLVIDLGPPFSSDFRGAHCQLSEGDLVEVIGRRTPLFDLARELDRFGYGEGILSILVPETTPARPTCSPLAGESMSSAPP